MSDTPRTDAEEFFPCESNYKVCEAGFTRHLERSLNAANDMIRRQQLLNARIKKLEDGIVLQMQRIHQLEAENDALRADLLLWSEKEVK